MSFMADSSVIINSENNVYTDVELNRGTGSVCKALALALGSHKYSLADHE